VIADITLLDGSGLDLMREAHEVHGLPTIALSGHDDGHERGACSRAGCSGRLLKPVTFAEVEAAILRAKAQPSR
jgi:DNA-binding NarL/FixJ family response regulator